MVIQAKMEGYTNDSLLVLAKPRVLDFSYLDHYFTPELLKSIHASEAAVAAGKATSSQTGNVLGAALWGIAGIDPGLTLRSPASRNFVYSGAKTDIATNATGQPLLVLKMSFSVQYLGQIKGKNVYYQVKHPETVRLVQTGDKAQPWKIDSYVISQDAKGPFPDNG